MSPPPAPVLHSHSHSARLRVPSANACWSGRGAYTDGGDAHTLHPDSAPHADLAGLGATPPPSCTSLPPTTAVAAVEAGELVGLLRSSAPRAAALLRAMQLLPEGAGGVGTSLSQLTTASQVSLAEYAVGAQVAPRHHPSRLQHSNTYDPQSTRPTQDTHPLRHSLATSLEGVHLTHPAGATMEGGGASPLSPPLPPPPPAGQLGGVLGESQGRELGAAFLSLAGLGGEDLTAHDPHTATTAHHTTTLVDDDVTAAVCAAGAPGSQPLQCEGGAGQEGGPSLPVVADVTVALAMHPRRQE